MSGPAFVVDGVLAGMCRPPYDKALKGFLGSLKRKGIGAIVSLTDHGPDASEIEGEGFEHLRLAVRDFSAPAARQIDRFVAFTRRFNRKTGEAVAVHCGSGLGRTGTMLACFLVAEGRSPAQAIGEVRRKRPGSVETEAQEKAVQNYSARLARRRKKRKKR